MIRVCDKCLGVHQNKECPCVVFTDVENKQAMEDCVLNTLDMMTPQEIAQCIREGITTMQRVEKALRAS